MTVEESLAIAREWYSAKTNASRAHVIKVAMRNCGASLTDVGRSIGLSRQRIHQILRGQARAASAEARYDRRRK